MVESLLLDGMTLDAWKGEALEAGIGYQIVGDEEVSSPDSNDYVEPLLLEEQHGTDYNNRMDAWNESIPGNPDITFQPYDPDCEADCNGDTWINTLTDKMFIWNELRGEWLPSDYKSEGGYNPSKMRDEEKRCENTYKILTAKIKKQDRVLGILEIMTYCDTLDELDSVISEVNIFSDLCIEANTGWYPFPKGGLDIIREGYLMLRDKLIASLIDNSNMSAYFTRSGDNPVIHDQGYQWDLVESEGGWNRLDLLMRRTFNKGMTWNVMRSCMMRMARSALET